MAFSRERGRAGAALVLAILLLFGCHLVSRTEAAPGDRMLDWRQTVQLEHSDRLARLRRLSDRSFAASPVFYETLIRKEDLPREFGVDMPVLRVVFPLQVFFDTGEATLRPEAQKVIDLVAETLRREAADTAVFVAGHTDMRGGAGYNYDLSVRRAETAAGALKAAGARQANVWRIGFGKFVPLAAGSSAEALARNRRVEFLFARRPEPVAVLLSRQLAFACKGGDRREQIKCDETVRASPLFEAKPVGVPGVPPAVVERRPPDNVPVPIPTPDPSTVRPLPKASDEVPAPRPAPEEVPGGAQKPETVTRQVETTGTVRIEPSTTVYVKVGEPQVFVSRPNL